MHCPFDSCKYESSSHDNMKRHISRFRNNETKDFQFHRLAIPIDGIINTIDWY